MSEWRNIDLFPMVAITAAGIFGVSLIISKSRDLDRSQHAKALEAEKASMPADIVSGIKLSLSSGSPNILRVASTKLDNFPLTQKALIGVAAELESQGADFINLSAP